MAHLWCPGTFTLVIVAGGAEARGQRGRDARYFFLTGEGEAGEWMDGGGGHVKARGVEDGICSQTVVV